MDFLADMPLGALLGIMIIPIISATILGAYLIFAINRRKKKSKPGSQLETPVSQPDSLASQPEAIADITPAPVDTPTLSNQEVLPPDVVAPPPPSNVIPETSQQTPQISQSLENRLNMALLSKDLNKEDTMPDMPTPSQLDNVDTGATAVSQPSGLPPDLETVELLRLLRDSQSGQLIVEVGGKRYTKLADITDKKIGQYILQLTAQLLAFTNGVMLTTTGMKSVGAPNVGPAPKPVVPPRQTPPPVPPTPPQVEAEFLDSLRKQTVPEPDPKPQQRGFLGLGKTSSDPSPTVPTLNLADEINEIVQNKLRYSPLAPHTQIEITSDPGGGIRIQVNNHFYSSPDDVPDQAARDLIKAAIKEWEKS